MRALHHHRLASHPSRRGATLVLALLGGAIAITSTGDARAQIVGSENKPAPNVLLLIDTSGSMERMSDNSLPTCTPGTATDPNRWGMLLQALTGSLQPYYSCASIDRTQAAFTNEYQINGNPPYDAGYFLPYHRPLTGTSPTTTTDPTCALAPVNLPGASGGSGVGVGKGGYGAGVLGQYADQFPDDAIAALQYDLYVKTQDASGLALSPTAANSCVFQQASDGQLDAIQDFVRLSMMTFDSQPEPDLGVTPDYTPTNSTATTGPIVTSGNPFTGTWSYLRSPTNPDFIGTGAAVGEPFACATTPIPAYEVGARNPAAPPWEGRMVRFPSPSGSTLDMERSSTQIQQVLLATRPSGATPLDGMLDDARDYLWYNDYGPYGSQDGYQDLYVKGGCRDQYIVLLTDGAPNLNLRPSCQGGPPDKCPYKTTAADTAKALYDGTGKHPVKTFVIGFSVNGTDELGGPDGFPTALANRTCRDWYADLTVGGKSDPKYMSELCSGTHNAPPGVVMPPPVGSTAAACCELNAIAYSGSGGNSGGPTPIGAYFAESQADLVLSFASILANVTQNASTRTVPAFAPVETINTVNTTAQFVSSFVPSAEKVWSGEIDRTRLLCDNSNPQAPPAPATQSISAGDFYSANTAAQAGARFVITAIADSVGASRAEDSLPIIDSSATIRPYLGTATVTPSASTPSYKATEYGAKDDAMLTLVGNNLQPAMNIGKATCKQSKYVPPGAAQTPLPIPHLSSTDCATAMWDFAVAHPGPSPTLSGTYNSGTATFDYGRIRCPSSGDTNGTAGVCSISGAGCNIASDVTGCTIAGETCVPKCSALGAVLRSSPVVVGPPQGLLRDDGYTQFQTLRATRRPTMFVATTDGVLHAFKALPDASGDSTDHYEQWAFIPPAVLPRIATDFPGGQQVLLDGTPVVADVVWDRTSAALDVATTSKNDWHTTLVAGFGAAGGGYYALNVSDADCGGATNATGICGSGTYEAPGAGAALTDVSIGGDASGGQKLGPHFLWQITDFPQNSALDPAPVTRTSYLPPSGTSTKFVALFGKQSATPAITTVRVTDGSNVLHQIGVAILPGGVDGPPQSGLGCARAGGADMSDPAYKARPTVRNWSTLSHCGPVAGRGITIVRLDTGEILRHFGRTTDVPTNILPVTTPTPFDSPMTGTPVVYPSTTGAAAQKVFIGDADGTIWRLDLSVPCQLTDMSTCKWSASLFEDMFPQSGPVSADATGAALESQPIAVPLALSQSPTGTLVVNAATGDQENIVVSNAVNEVMSVEETLPDPTTGAIRAQVDWFNPLPNGERVTGPMTVFNSALYFASYRPPTDTGSGVCASGAISSLWAMSYRTQSTAGITNGGLPLLCPGFPPPATCAAGSQVQSVTTTGESAGQIIPGVTLQATSCSHNDTLPDGTGSYITGISQTQFQLSFGLAAPRGGGGTTTNTAGRVQINLAVPQIATRVDAWAFVID